MLLDILPPWQDPPPNPYPPPDYNDVAVTALLLTAVVLLWVFGYSRSRSR